MYRFWRSVLLLLIGAAIGIFASPLLPTGAQDWISSGKERVETFVSPFSESEVGKLRESTRVTGTSGAETAVSIKKFAGGWTFRLYSYKWQKDVLNIDLGVAYDGEQKRYFGIVGLSVFTDCWQFNAFDQNGNRGTLLNKTQVSDTFCRNFWPGGTQRTTLEFQLGPRSEGTNLCIGPDNTAIFGLPRP